MKKANSRVFSLALSSVRSRLSQFFYPPLFLGCFALFHVYFFAFPFGFSYVALCTSALFLCQTMLYFFNCIEIPALEAGDISVDVPRERLRVGNLFVL